MPRETSLPAFVSAFGQLGFQLCSDEGLDPECEKVAIFARDNVPTHAARQLPAGTWTSKLGESVDVEHELADLTGDVYGQVACLLQRPKGHPIVKA